MRLVNKGRPGNAWKLGAGLATIVFGCISTAAAQTAYTVIDLGTMGGTWGCAMGLNNSGWAELMDSLPGEQEHAGVWVRGVKIDFGTFGGPELNSSIWYGGVNDNGLAVGYSETSAVAPNGEDFCGFGTRHVCVPFVWQLGVMSQLPTLGGTNGQAAAVNNRGQVAGGAQNTASDPACPPFQSTRPVIWENGQPRELVTYPGDPDGFAFAINGLGQAVGTSGRACESFDHALLWDGATVANLPSLGGEMNNVPLAINNLGQAVGWSDLTGDNVTHAVLWQGGAASDLGTLFPDDVWSEGDGINDKGQVIGGSCGQDGNCTAFIWQGGTMTDLNDLIPADSALYLMFGHDINPRGEIVGMAVWNNTEIHAFLAVPTNPAAANGSGWLTRSASRARVKVTLPENVRNLLKKGQVLHRFARHATSQ